LAKAGLELPEKILILSCMTVYTFQVGAKSKPNNKRQMIY